jgi:hypothetical protein
MPIQTAWPLLVVLASLPSPCDVSIVPPRVPDLEPVSGLVETGYETSSFVVLENRDDGWVRFRYGKPVEGRDGLAWTHACHIEAQGLRFETWEDRFLSDEISPLTFRSPVPHALRAGPAESSKRGLWISGDYHLEVGWMRWRSPEKGPWVWYYTRGC